MALRLALWNLVSRAIDGWPAGIGETPWSTVDRGVGQAHAAAEALTCMLHIRLSDPSRVPSLIDFFGRVSGIATPTSDPHVVAVELPGAPSAAQERREVRNYLQTWLVLEGGCDANVI
jgi:hypothetical protein